MKRINVFIATAITFTLLLNIFPRQITEFQNCYREYGNGSLLIKVNGFPFVSYINDIELDKVNMVCVASVDSPYNEGVQFAGLLYNTLTAFLLSAVVTLGYSLVFKRKD